MRASFVSLSLAVAFAASSASAHLPGLDDKEWLGRFMGYQDRSFRFGLMVDGKGLIQPMKDRKSPVNDRSCPTLYFIVEEMVPGRDPVTKKIDPTTLETTDQPTLGPGTVTFRGKVSGDAVFEAVVTNDRGNFSVGGHIVDPGKTKHPLRFSVRATFRSIYYKPANDKAFEKKLSKDGVSLVRLDGKKLKFDGGEEVDAKSDEVNGSGIQEAQISFSPYMGNDFVFKASPNSSLRLWNQGPGPLHQGFSLNWYPDPANDPENKARLHFTVK